MNELTKKSVVLVSGGMDSLVTTAIAVNEIKTSKNHSLDSSEPLPLYLIHFNYGHKTENKELWCFKEIAKFYQIPESQQKIVNVGFLKEIGGSSLTDKNIEVKNFKKEESGIPDSYVPFRNTIFLSLSVALAEVVGASKIYIGAVHEDSSGYPDCRPSYYKAMNNVIKEGTKNQNIEIVTPVISYSKDQIIKKGQELNAPFEYSWSCYSSEDFACGICDSCALRLRAFERLNLMDPIPYKTRPQYL